MTAAAAIEALIVGGGPAGSAAAITLARAGMAPHLVDRQPISQHGVCGGFLGWDAIAALKDLGVDPWELGARPISRFRLVTASRCVEADLPDIAAGLSRRVLDTALIEGAAAAGAIVTRGRAARAADPSARTVRFDNGETVRAQALFLGVGKHELRGVVRDFSASSVGLRASLPPSAARSSALADVVEMHLFDHGYAGLLLQEDGSANLCLSIERERLGKAGSVRALMQEVLRDAPALGARMDGDGLPNFDAVAGVPYGWRARDSQSGIFRIGDQGAVIASLAGDGIAIALASGASAARALLAGGPGAASHWQRRWGRQCRRPVGLAEMLRRGAAAAGTRDALMALLYLAPGLGMGAAALTRVSQS